MRVLDLFEECLFSPCGVFLHSVSIYLCFRDHSTGNLSIDNFVPDSGFGEGDGWVSQSQCVHNHFSRLCNVRVFRLVAECDSEIVFLCPPSQDCFDVVVLGACYIDFIGDDVCGCLDSFPGSIPAESKGVDLPVLEGKPFGPGVDRGSGFGSLMCRLVFGQNVRVVCGIGG